MRSAAIAARHAAGSSNPAPPARATRTRAPPTSATRAARARTRPSRALATMRTRAPSATSASAGFVRPVLLRHRQARHVDRVVAVENEVEVQRPGGAHAGAHAAACALERQQARHQLRRRQIGAAYDRRVQIRRLVVGHVDRRGLDDRRCPEISEELAETLDGPEQMSAPVPEVGAEGDGDGGGLNHGVLGMKSA